MLVIPRNQAYPPPPTLTPITPVNLMSEWTDIGEKLRKARESKCLDLRDIAHSTRIPTATLHALEESDYSIFPSPTYARSFLSQYSDFLGVDAHEWIDAFETGDVLSNINDHGYLQSDHDHIGPLRQESSPAKRLSRDDSQKTRNPSGHPILQAFTVFFFTALLIFGGIYAYKKYEPILSGAPADEENTKKTSDDPTTSPADLKTPVKPETTKKTEPKPTPEPPPVAKNNSPSLKKTETAKKPILIKPRIAPPPKALIIEDEEE